MTGERRTWWIEVCRTCDRVAEWPFCDHRDMPPPEGYGAWFVGVLVQPTSRAKRYRVEVPSQ